MHEAEFVEFRQCLSTEFLSLTSTGKKFHPVVGHVGNRRERNVVVVENDFFSHKYKIANCYFYKISTETYQPLVGNPFQV